MDKEYIEREELREVVNNLRLGRHLNKDATLNLMERAIDNLPTADVVEVVRCKDCKYYGDEHFCPLLSLADYTDPHDFCSYGERRDNNADDLCGCADS